MTWIDHYREHYRPLLNHTTNAAKRGLEPGLYCRAQGFDIMFEHLLGRAAPYHIIETGTMRKPGNWKDGCSAMLFTEFVDAYSGTVRSVDIDPAACQASAAAIASPNFSVTCSDSVSWLNQQTDLGQVALFYLDSYDVKWDNDTPSAQHHLREFQAIEPYITPGTMVAIDDNARRVQDGSRTGKARMIVEYLEQKGIAPIYDAYQIIYLF